MKMPEWFPLVLCLTVSSARAADNDFTGVGVELRLEGQTIVVNHILPDTPAAAQKDLHVGGRQGKVVAVNPRDLSQVVNDELEEKPVANAG